MWSAVANGETSYLIMEELEEVLKTNLSNNALLAPVDILALLITAVEADLLAVLPGDLLTLLNRIGATYLNRKET